MTKWIDLCFKRDVERLQPLIRGDTPPARAEQEQPPWNERGNSKETFRTKIMHFNPLRRVQRLATYIGILSDSELSDSRQELALLPASTSVTSALTTSALYLLATYLVTWLLQVRCTLHYISTIPTRTRCINAPRIRQSAVLQRSCSTTSCQQTKHAPDYEPLRVFH